METVSIDKAYIISRMEELKTSPVMQEYIYLQSRLKASEVVPEEVKEETKD